MTDVSQSGDSRRERAIEAARNATALLAYNRNAAAAVADAVLAVADQAAHDEAYRPTPKGPQTPVAPRGDRR